jgi:hypothetical protein
MRLKVGDSLLVFWLFPPVAARIDELTGSFDDCDRCKNSLFVADSIAAISSQGHTLLDSGAHRKE